MTTRPRDATAPIRGFVYQVDVTLLRWLQLDGSTYLELETGEDLDHIRDTLADGNALPDRLFEGVKHREANLTLRSVEAVEALAAFAEHRVNNPTLSLEFRYLTNCGIGHERPSITDDGTPGIRLWEDIRMGRVSPDHVLPATATIQKHLQSLKRPSVLDEITWSHFQDVLNLETEQFSTFLKRFTWSTQSPDASEMREEVLAAIKKRKDLSNAADAVRVYEHLFAKVFRLLATVGSKRLSASELDTSLANLYSDEADRLIMTTISAWETRFAQRLTAIEEQLRAQTPLLNEILSSAQNRNPPPGMEGVSFSTALPPIPLDLPLPEVRVSARARVIESLSAEIDRSIWFALNGGIGTGKTHLSLQLTMARQVPRAWIRLMETVEGGEHHYLDQAMMAIGKRLVPITELYQNACFELKGGILVIDDLPRLDERKPLTPRLRILVDACKQNNVRLLTTSAHTIPVSIERLIGGDLKQLPAPPLDEDEVREVLIAHGCPAESATKGHVSLVTLVSQGHPLLVMAVVRVFEAHGWQLSPQALNDLLLGNLGQDLTDSVQDWLRDTVTEPLSRELLYRLKIIAKSFSEADLLLVSRVSPSITSPLDHMRALSGLWVQRQAEGKYALSPLVGRLPPANLAPETSKQVHLALARSILRKGTLDPFDALQAILHFVAGEELGGAAFVLNMALLAFATAPDPIPQDFGLTLIWAFQPIPDVIALSEQVFIRTGQAAICLRRGQDAEYLLNDLERLLEKAGTKDGFAVLAAAGLTSMWLAELSPTRAAKFILKGLASLRDNELVKAHLPIPVLRRSFLELLWIMASWIRSAKEMRGWLLAIGELHTSDKAEFDSIRHVADDACASLTSHMWLEELKQPETLQDWNRVFSELEELRAAAVVLKLPTILGHAYKAQLIVRAEMQAQMDEALGEGKRAIADSGPDQRSRFLIADAGARQLYRVNRFADSLSWWEEVAASQDSGSPFEVISALTHAGASAGRVGDMPQAFEYLNKAIERLPELQTDQWLVATRALGERAVAQWGAGNRDAAYRDWARATRMLRDNKDQTTRWKVIFRIMANCGGYFAHEVGARGTPWQYMVPRPGILLEYPEVLADSYVATQDWLLHANLGMIATAVNEIADAAEWIELALTEGTRDEANGFLFRAMEPTLWIHRLPWLYVEGRLEEILTFAIKLSTSPIETEDYPSPEKTPEQQRAMVGRVRRFAGEVSILTVVLGLMRIATHKQRRDLCRQFADTCAVVAPDGPSSTLWAGATLMFSALSQSSCTAESFYERGRVVDEQDSILGAAHYLAASLVGSPVHAWRLQLAALPSLKSSFWSNPYQHIFSQIIAPAVTEYWSIAVEESGFLFLNPRLTKRIIAEARSGNMSPQRVSNVVLLAVSAGLGLQPTAEQLVWLRDVE